MPQATAADVLDEVVDTVEVDEEELDEPGEGETPPEADDDSTAETTDETTDEVVVTIGDEEPPDDEQFDGKPAPAWVKDLRESNRAQAKRIRELEQAQQQAKPKAEALGPKPMLADFQYDEDAHEKALDAWHAKKREAEVQETKQREAGEAIQAEWDKRVGIYETQKAALKVKDFDEAKEAAAGVFSVVQQSVIISGAENAALVVYALGRNPKAAKELASITDPVKFAFAVAKLETKLKVQPRKTAPAPDTPVRSNAPVSGTVDSQLERLRADAAKTGDMSKVHAYKQQLRGKARK